ncbi:MAG: hypothetical protein WCK01_02695 [Candidatus Uhrbacteria bacterium]
MKRAISIILLVAIFVGMGDFGRLNIAQAKGSGDAANLYLDGAPSGLEAVVAKQTSHLYRVELTVGQYGIAADADSPTFTIPTGFTAPHANGGATVPTNSSEVNVDGEWFVEASGGTCAVAMGTSGASGQVITVDVTGNCPLSGAQEGTGIINFYYKGISSTVAGPTELAIFTDSVAGGSAAVSIQYPVHITMYGEGAATVSDQNESAGASVTAEKETLDKMTIVLTVGPNGIASDADSPIFSALVDGNLNIFSHPVASTGLVVADGDYFITASGGTCAVDMGATSGYFGGDGRSIAADVVGNCVAGNTISLTYIALSHFGSASPSEIRIQTDDYAGGGPLYYIQSPPVVYYVDTIPPAVSTVVVQDMDQSGTINGGDNIVVTFNDQMLTEWWMYLNDWVDAYLGINNGHTFDVAGAGGAVTWNHSPPEGNYMIRQLTVTLGAGSTIAPGDTIDPPPTAYDASMNGDATPAPLPILLPQVVSARSNGTDGLQLLRTTLAQPVYSVDYDLNPSFTNVSYAWKQPKAFTIANGDPCIALYACAWIILELQTDGTPPLNDKQEWQPTISSGDFIWNGPANSSVYGFYRSDEDSNDVYETLFVSVACSSACSFATSTEYSMTIVNNPIKNPQAPPGYTPGSYMDLTHTFSILDNSATHQNDASLVSKVVVGLGLTVTANVEPTLSFSVSGFTTPASFYSDSVSIDNSLASDTCSLGVLSPATPKVCAWYLNIATNASNGYSIYVVQDQDMSFNGNSIKQFKDSVRVDDSAATAWTVPDSGQLGHLGYSSNDTDIFPPTGGTTAVWAGIPTVAGANEAPVTTGLVASNSLPESHQYTYAIKVESAATLPQGANYSHHEYFMVVGNF